MIDELTETKNAMNEMIRKLPKIEAVAQTRIG